MSLMGAVWRSPASLVARIELIAYLLIPFWQGIVGLMLVAAIVLALTGVTGFWEGGPWWQLAFFYLLGFGGTMLGCIAARARDGAVGAIAGFCIAQVYAFYSWLLWPVLARSSLRQLTHRSNWVKSDREALPSAPPVSPRA
jgi:hypothetical membrane protein